MSEKGSRMRMEREPGWCVAIVALAAAVTVASIAVPEFRLRVESPAGGAIVLALRGTAWLFVAALAAQRFSRTASRLDATIGVALGIFAVVDIGFALGYAAILSAQASPASVLPYGVFAS